MRRVAALSKPSNGFASPAMRLQPQSGAALVLPAQFERLSEGHGRTPPSGLVVVHHFRSRAGSGGGLGRR
jgi:hypothetical protein